MDERVAVLLGKLERALVGIVVDVAREHDLRPQLAGALDLDVGRRLGHDDDGLHAVARRRERDALRVVARACRDKAPRALLVGERRDLVVGAAYLVGTGALQVLRLEVDLIAREVAEVRASDELGLERDLPHFLGGFFERFKRQHDGTPLLV